MGGDEVEKETEERLIRNSNAVKVMKRRKNRIFKLIKKRRQRRRRTH